MKVLAVLIAFVAGVCARENSTLDIHEPLTLTISPKIWNLLQTKSDLITNTIKSIKLPEKKGKVKELLKYEIWDGYLEDFFLPSFGVSFENMNNGVHLRVRTLQFVGSTKARLYIGGETVTGDIRVKSIDAELDVILTWNDFTFTPTISMNSNLRIEFTQQFQSFNLIKSQVQKYASRAINKKVREKLAEVIVNKLNPSLQELKEELKARGLATYDIEWTVQNQTLRVGFKPKSSTGVVSPVKPIDKMLCVEVNVESLMRRTKRSALLSNIDVDATCVNPVATCGGHSCSYCTDVDVNPHHPNAFKKIFFSCIPWF